MTTWLDADPAADGFGSWEEVTECLLHGWDLVSASIEGPSVHRFGDTLCLLEPPGVLRARQRRALHRAGFRVEPGGRRRLWAWSPAEPALPPRAEPGASAGAVVVALLHRRAAANRSLAAQAVLVLHDVLRADVAGVVVHFPLLQGEDDPAWC